MNLPKNSTSNTDLETGLKVILLTKKYDVEQLFSFHGSFIQLFPHFGGELTLYG